jgi:Barstar (barnase inhibitor)
MHRVPRRFFRDVRQSFEEEGWRVFVLPDGINDHASFVQAATALFPLDPPWYGGSWDAFDDSLWEGLSELPERRIAILWPDAVKLAGSDPKTYEMALDGLESVSEDLADAKATVGNPKDLAVVVGT